MMNAALFPALETLLAVARTGSVAGAARQRHITSSAVSQQIRRLEAHFGIKFFERAGRGFRLSARGEAALPVVRELGRGRGGVRPAAELTGHPATTLRVAVSDYLGKALRRRSCGTFSTGGVGALRDRRRARARGGVRLVARGMSTSPW
jgi:DNA-binding transcriptional LysR family regulator